MAELTSAVDFLSKKRTGDVPRVVVLFGDDGFLITQCRHKLQGLVLEGDDELGRIVLEGSEAVWADVHDELCTPSLFGGTRLVTVVAADGFVSAHRGSLEDFVERLPGNGVLVLEVATWPANTRLAKAVAQRGLTIDCKAPAAAKLTKWLVAWCREQHEATLEPAAAEHLLEIVGPELGLLDQELAKLAAYAGTEAQITDGMVGELVGGWRAKTTWDMLDAALAGKAGEALGQLDRLLHSGENPIGLLAQMGASLRKLAAAASLLEQDARGQDLRSALQAAGVPSFVLGKAEAQLRQLGRGRARALLGWLLEADLALKGGSQLANRTILERLLAQMSQKLAPVAAGRR